MKHQREIMMRQQELAAKEESLRALETRLGEWNSVHCRRGADRELIVVAFVASQTYSQ
jgi:hypothetical protein